MATQASVVAFQPKAGALQTHWLWPASALEVLYSAVVPQGVHEPCAPAEAEKVCAGHARQLMSEVVVQVEAPS